VLYRIVTLLIILTDANHHKSPIFRPHRSTTYVDSASRKAKKLNTKTDSACCYRQSSMVCRSVILVSLAEMAEPIEVPFGLRTWVGPGNHV